VCSKSGADYGLKLTWALVVASFVAFVLQEGAARLSIVSGAGLGQVKCWQSEGECSAILAPPIIVDDDDDVTDILFLKGDAHSLRRPPRLWSNPASVLVNRRGKRREGVW
jgi:hypothetical protein